jgi:hypothetical protein
MTLTEVAMEEIIRQVSIHNNESEYRYFLIKRKSENVSSFRLPLYSIRIELEASSGKTSRHELTNVFASESKANSFFDKLVKNLATPLNLPYVFEDEMS